MTGFILPNVLLLFSQFIHMLHSTVQSSRIVSDIRTILEDLKRRLSVPKNLSRHYSREVASNQRKAAALQPARAPPHLEHGTAVAHSHVTGSTQASLGLFAELAGP
jgi:hypothetical protein